MLDWTQLSETRNLHCMQNFALLKGLKRYIWKENLAAYSQIVQTNLALKADGLNPIIFINTLRKLFTSL